MSAALSPNEELNIPATDDLTTDTSTFIRQAQRQGKLYIRQPYELYSAANHESWSMLFHRMEEKWEKYANRHFLVGIDKLHLDPDRIPTLEHVNRFLAPLTGFTTRPVAGFMPAFHFFDCLKRRQFPTTVTIRPYGAEFAEWPDIFHDITGHVPMHTDPAFADALVRFGDCAHTAIEILADVPDRAVRRQRLTNIIKALARFFWFTVETGLMQEADGLKVYGSAMLSSSREIESCLSDRVQKYPIQLEWVVNQGFEPNRYQPLLFWVQSFSHLYTLVDQLETWMRDGKLDDLAPGDPQVSDQDLASFTEI